MNLFKRACFVIAGLVLLFFTGWFSAFLSNTLGMVWLAVPVFVIFACCSISLLLHGMLDV